MPAPRITGAAGPYARPLLSGQWRATQGGSSATGTLNVGVERCQILEVPPSTRLQAVAVNVTSAGVGAVIRLGARADEGGRPGALLADWTTVGADTAGEKSLSINFVVPSPRLWLSVTGQVAVCTCSSRTSAGSPVDGLTAADMISNSTPIMVFATGVTGALPAAFTAAGISNNATLVLVQAA